MLERALETKLPIAVLLLVLAGPASAGIHTWDVREVFSNADGTIQFVELIDNGVTGGEVNVGNGSITTNLQGVISWSNGPVAPPTNGRSYLIATPDFASLPGAPTPDVIVAPADVPIFDNTGDTVSFGAFDSMTFGVVPTNGLDSLDDVTGVGLNSPTNYAGASGSVDASPPGIGVGVFDDFQSATTEGWVASLGLGVPPVPPVAVADAGPLGAGDFALRITGTGSPFGAGGKLVVNNVDPRWTGDYTAAGVAGVLIDVNNPNAFPLWLRIGIAEPLGVSVGGRWVTPRIFVPATSGWLTLEFPLDPAFMLPGDPVAPDVNVTLADVGILRVLHSNAVAFAGEAIAGQLEIDNVEAVPEPTLVPAVAAGALALAAVRRRRAA